QQSSQCEAICDRKWMRQPGRGRARCGMQCDRLDRAGGVEDARRLPAVDLVNQTIRKRYHEQVTVRPSQQVGDDTEVPAEKEAFAFRDIELADIVGDPIGKTRIVDGDVRAVSGQLEAEQMPALE